LLAPGETSYWGSENMSDAKCKQLWKKYDDCGWTKQRNLGLLLRDCGITATQHVLNEYITEFPPANGRICFADFRNYYRAKKMRSKGSRITESNRSRESRSSLPPSHTVYGRPSAREKENAASSLRWDHDTPQERKNGGSVRETKHFQGRKEVDWCSKESLQDLIEHNTYGQTPEHSRKTANALDKDAGIICLVRKVRTYFQSQGVNGLVALRQLFKDADLDGNNTLDFSEFAQVLREMQLPITRRELRILFDSLDEDGDEMVDFNEFQRLLQR
jgi:Ca2+-binding EF-hand superfamily protein